ncbi:MAG: hypothetical protein R3217_06275 [Gammaproteobacteria bacterium]|nr:hypothetical protein [Gammaproteobacteria bacterium]
MGVEIKISDKEIPVSPVFVDFLVHIVENKPFGKAQWHDQLSEELSQEHKSILEKAAENAEKVMKTEVGQQCIGRSYQIFLALLAGQTPIIKEIQSRFHFINVIGVPRNGGSYLTKELYRGLGYDPEKVPNVIAHDGFPEAGPFRFQPGANSWTMSLATMAEFLTMVEIYFGQAKTHMGKIVVPKKLLKGSYAGGFFQEVLGSAVDHLFTVRHPVTSAISTYEKSGGLPENGKFAVRGNIEEWVRRDLTYTGVGQQEIFQMDYFDAYLRYWEQYHYYVATTGLSANKNIDIVAYGKERMEAVSQRWHTRFESGQAPSEFKVFDKRDRHPEWIKQAEPVIKRVNDVWERVGLDFPMDEVMECW